jgi:autotransporter-associated beta strand protein
MHTSRLLSFLLLLLTNASSHAAVTLAGSAWYNGNASGHTSPNPADTGYWIPGNQGNITGITFSPGDRNQFGTNTGTAYLQNLIFAQAPSGASTSAFATIIDLTTNTVVGSSISSVAAGNDNTNARSTNTPFRFDSLALDSSKTYAVIFTTTAATPGTNVTIPSTVGSLLASGTNIDDDGGSLIVNMMRFGGTINPPDVIDLISNTGAFLPAAQVNFADFELWHTATFTSTDQHLTTLNAASGSVSQSSPLDVEGIRKTGTGSYILNNISNLNSGDVIIEQGTLRLDGNTTSSALVGSGQIMINNYGAQNQASQLFGGATLQLNPTSGTLNVDNSIEGVGTILKTGAGQVELTAANSFTGTIQINQGKLALKHLEAAGGKPHVSIGDNGVFSLAGLFVNQTAIISSLSGSGAVDAQYESAAGIKTLEVRQNIDTTYSGVLRNSTSAADPRRLALTKSGTGILRLTGNNTYTGPTIINGGTLVINGLHSIPDGAPTAGHATTVNANGTLAGTGTISSPAAIKSGGVLAAGDPTLASTLGTLTFNAGLTLEAGSTSIFELSGATGTFSDPLHIDSSLLTSTADLHDHFEINGSLNLGDGSLIKIQLLSYVAGYGDVFNLIDWSTPGNAIATGFDPLTDFDFSEALLTSGLQWNTDRFLSDGIIYVTPEPSRALLIMLGACLSILSRRRP